MSDELDPVLARAFAQAREPLADGEFMAKLMMKIDRARRIRLWRQIVVIAAFALLAGLNAGPVLETTADVVRLAGTLPPAYADLFVSPWGWALSGLIGAWVVFRTRPTRR
jgi:predicted lysophospholipase L1 biosynthesis ABC-type transport system permease subunit